MQIYLPIKACYSYTFKNQLSVCVYFNTLMYMLLCSADSEDKDKGTYENLCDPCMANSY